MPIKAAKTPTVIVEKTIICDASVTTDLMMSHDVAEFVAEGLGGMCRAEVISDDDCLGREVGDSVRRAAVVAADGESLLLDDHCDLLPQFAIRLAVK